MTTHPYYRVARSLLSSPQWLAEKFTRGQAWVDLVGLANYKPGHIRKRGIKVEIPRGGVGWSEVKLAERWQWSRGRVRRFLGELKTAQQIEQQIDNVTSCIYIVNYDLYQGDDTAEQTPNGTASDTADGQQTEQQTVPEVRSEEVKKVIKEPKPPSPSADGAAPKVSAVEREFNTEFWPACPYKIGKRNALKAYTAARKRSNKEAIIGGLPAYKAQQEDRRDKSPDDFSPLHPTTWLNGDRWEDVGAREKAQATTAAGDAEREQMFLDNPFLRAAKGLNHGEG